MTQQPNRVKFSERVVTIYPYDQPPLVFDKVVEFAYTDVFVSVTVKRDNEVFETTSINSHEVSRWVATYKIDESSITPVQPIIAPGGPRFN